MHGLRNWLVTCLTDFGSMGGGGGGGSLEPRLSSSFSSLAKWNESLGSRLGGGGGGGAIYKTDKCPASWANAFPLIVYLPVPCFALLWGLCFSSYAMKEFLTNLYSVLRCNVIVP